MFWVVEAQAPIVFEAGAGWVSFFQICFVCVSALESTVTMGSSCLLLKPLSHCHKFWLRDSTG